MQSVGSNFNSLLGYTSALIKAVTLPAATQQAVARVKNMTGEATMRLNHMNFTTCNVCTVACMPPHCML
jgi:hypothetical protein